MNARIVPLQVDCILNEGARDPWRAFENHGFPRRIAEDKVRHDLAAHVQKAVHLEVLDGPDHLDGAKVLRGTVYLAEGWGDIEAAARARLALAKSAEDMAHEFASRLHRDRRAFEVEMKRARAEFAGSFQRALEEFHGYDECAGRR